VGTTVGTFLVETVTADGMSAAGAGALLAIGSVTSVAIRIVIGVHADRLSGGHLLRVAALLVAGVPGFLLLAAGSGPLLVLGAMLAFGGGWGWAGLLNFAVVRRNRDRAATSAGVVLSGVRGRLRAARVRARRRALVLLDRLGAVRSARPRRRARRPRGPGDPTQLKSAVGT
jgi:cyanate permease